MQVVAFALEKRMFFDGQHNVEITRRPTMRPGLSQSGETNAGSVFHSGGDLGVHRPLAQHAAFAFALGTRICNNAACALTRGASTGHAEESLLVAHLSTPPTGSAKDWRLAGGRSDATAVLTGFMAANRNLSFRAEYCFFELQRDIFPP